MFGGTRKLLSHQPRRMPRGYINANKERDACRMARNPFFDCYKLKTSAVPHSFYGPS